MLSEQDKEAARKIGEFYLQKNTSIEGVRDFKATEREIMDLRISKVKVNGDTVEITTERPGLLIGRRAINIDALTKYLEMKVKIIEESDPITYYLIPQNWDEYDY